MQNICLSFLSLILTLLLVSIRSLPTKIVIDIARTLQNSEIEYLYRFSEGVLPK